MSNNAYFVQYYFNIIPFTYNSYLDALSIGTRINFFLSASRQLMTSICFRIGLNLDVLILVLSFEIFLSTYVEMADFQGVKDSSDILFIR